jgi:protein gp37
VAETTGIAWTDSTFNPWIGCTKVGPGCDHCYAEALDKRHRWKGATHWGAGVERMRTAPSNWAKPLAWNAKAAASGKPWRVFCASLADVFDNEVPQEWRTDLFRMIAKTPALTWLLLTKRIGNALPMLHKMMVDAPPLPNVWIGATIVNREEADRDVPKLLATPAAIRFVSYEPALGPVDWRRYPGIDWIIVGGESTQGAKARPFDITAARSTITQCREINAAPFVKQLGSAPIWSHCIGNSQAIDTIHFKDRAGADPTEWPEDLRVQEFPSAPVQNRSQKG